jgi:hypothetical protein
VVSRYLDIYTFIAEHAALDPDDSKRWLRNRRGIVATEAGVKASPRGGRQSA